MHLPEIREQQAIADVLSDVDFLLASLEELVAKTRRCASGGPPWLRRVDVFEREPVLGASDPLLQLPDALCTPHLGYVARDNYERYFGIAFDNINAFAAGQPRNVVTASRAPG